MAKKPYAVTIVSTVTTTIIVDAISVLGARATVATYGVPEAAVDYPQHGPEDVQSKVTKVKLIRKGS